MPDDSDSTVPSNGHAPLIAAAWQQVVGLRGPLASSRAAAQQAATAAPVGAAEAFPGYTALEEIERGGQGVVYKALQESTQRVVAIKVLRDRVFLSDVDIQRFQQEVRVLGRLRHANIVRIYDSLAADRRFYYVMDYIPGRPLDEHVRTAVTSLREIVRLFVKICDAINAAHLRGIIHRDLKPGNIRVDPEGEPYVLDFGLSKLVDEERSDATVSGQFIGSMPWASPEQAAGKTDAIDIRTDVYSLGVLLYQMLTGSFPYVVRGPVNEILSQIMTADAAAPRSHNPAIPLDLETIVLKCLQKAPERRYQSAGDLGRDLQRWLAGEPIEARRDSLTYVLVKKLARYRLAAIASAGVLLATVGGLIVSIRFWREADAARADAVFQGRLAAQNETRARASADQASLESAAAKAVADFLTQMITSVDPYKGGSYDVRVADTLDAAVRRLDGGALAARPELEGRIRRVLGNAYSSLGLSGPGYEQLTAAVLCFEDARGPDSAEALRAGVDLLTTERRVLRTEECELAARRGLARAQLALGQDHAATLGMMNELAAALLERGALAEAESLWREAIDLGCLRFGDGYVEALAMTNNLAHMFWRRGKLEAAQALFEDLIVRTREVQGEDHPAYATRIVNLAMVYERRGRLTDAERMYSEALATLRRIHGDRHPELAPVLINIADLYRVQQRFTEAEIAAREALAFCEQVFEPGHVNIAKAMHNLGATLYSLARYDEAAPCARRAIEIYSVSLSPDDDEVLGSRGVLAAIHRARGELDEAIELMRGIHAARLRRLGAADLRRLRSYANLAELLAEKGMLAEAEAAFREVLARRRIRLGETHPETLTCAVNLAACLGREGAPEQAEAMLREALECLRDGRQYADTAHAIAALAQLVAEQGRFDEAEVLYRECLGVGGRALPADHPELIEFRAGLSAALRRLGRIREAIDELRLAHDALQAVFGDENGDVRRLRDDLEELEREQPPSIP